MGWGICFDLDANGQVYCRDGCRWHSKASDYADFVPWPSAREQVLNYYESDAHRELDMIRDECPGTAAALAEACQEHLGAAFWTYKNLSTERKIALHENKMRELTEDIEALKDQIADATEQYRHYKKAFKELKPSPKPPKTRVDELHEALAPLQAELAMELAATRVDGLTRTRANLVKQLNKEKKFLVE